MNMIEIIGLYLTMSSVIMISYVSVSNYYATRKETEKD
jgi:hypothetical protein